MDLGDKLMVFFIVILLFSISYAVFETARDIREIKDVVVERTHLPSECQQYYNDGTDQWKECMGVGYK